MPNPLFLRDSLYLIILSDWPVLVDYALPPHGRLYLAHVPVAAAGAPDVAEGGEAQVLEVALPEGGGGHAGRVVRLFAVGQAVLEGGEGVRW